MHRFRPAFMSQYSVGQMIFSQSEWLFDKSAYEPAEMMDRYLRMGHSTGITLLGGKSNQQRITIGCAPRILPIRPRTSPSR
ncbi:hypothetical protein ACFOJE_12790 [Azotobacter bryophylli]|uniref:Uncharacterized protein n=1 Tax=Azotobacter bryophylli TaxID=1986537 RepID=A0ABV7AU78_9GAMM